MSFPSRLSVSVYCPQLTNIRDFKRRNYFTAARVGLVQLLSRLKNESSHGRFQIQTSFVNDGWLRHSSCRPPYNLAKSYSLRCNASYTILSSLTTMSAAFLPTRSPYIVFTIFAVTAVIFFMSHCPQQGLSFPSRVLSQPDTVVTSHHGWTPFGDDASGVSLMYPPGWSLANKYGPWLVTIMSPDGRFTFSIRVATDPPEPQFMQLGARQRITLDGKHYDGYIFSAPGYECYSDASDRDCSAFYIPVAHDNVLYIVQGNGGILDNAIPPVYTDILQTVRFPAAPSICQLAMVS
jgi:hypothetical protein